MALTSSQKRKAREKLAAKHGVSADSITDSMLQQAITTNIITTSDYGSSYDCGSSSSSYDSGSSSSSFDSGCY